MSDFSSHSDSSEYSNSNSSELESEIRLTFELDLNDSNAMESINLSGAKVIEDSNNEKDKYIVISESKRYVTVELDVKDVNTMKQLMTSGIKMVLDKDHRNDIFITAIDNKSFEVGKMLVEAGAVDLFAQDRFRQTALYSAVTARADLDLCKSLINAGSNVNQKEIDGWTPLMSAIERDHEEVVRLLIENSCDLNQKNSIGWSAIMISVMFAQSQISRILLENGADFTANDFHGSNALDRSKESKHGETSEIISKAFRLHRSTLFIHCIEYLRNHRQEYEEEEVREYIPDHVMNGFLRNTIWKTNFK